MNELESEVLNEENEKNNEEKNEEGGGEGQRKKRKIKKQELGGRSLELMRLCYDQGFLTTEHIRQWFRHRCYLSNEETARVTAGRPIRFLQEEQLMEVFEIELKDPKRTIEALRLTSKGLGLLSDRGGVTLFDLVASPIDPEHVLHDLIATEVRLVWEKTLSNFTWTSERLLRTDNRDNIPDAELKFQHYDLKRAFNIAIEVERTQKGTSRYEKKFRDYENGAYDSVFYLSSHPDITDMIHKVSRDISDIIFVCNTNEFLKYGREARFVSHNDHFQLQERIPCVKL